MTGRMRKLSAVVVTVAFLLLALTIVIAYLRASPRAQEVPEAPGPQLLVLAVSDGGKHQGEPRSFPYKGG